MARAIWKGSIAFGLVQIPVELHVAEEAHEISFRQLDKHDLSPVGYDRVNKRTGKKVPWEDIVRGYEWDKGTYVVLSDDELKSANPKATHTIDIVAFVDAKDVDEVYFSTPYYLTPAKVSSKAYALLRETLHRTGRVGIAKIVIRTRQHLAALVPRDNALVLVTLRYAHELRDARDLALPKERIDKLGVTKAELDMANTLVEGMHQKWDPEQYKDDFRDDVMALVEKKVHAGEINTIEEIPAAHEPNAARANVVDLMEMLKKSVQAQETPHAKATAKARPRKHARKSA
jgi:DNA end-binding protein Ku